MDHNEVGLRPNSAWSRDPRLADRRELRHTTHEVSIPSVDVATLVASASILDSVGDRLVAFGWLSSGVEVKDVAVILRQLANRANT